MSVEIHPIANKLPAMTDAELESLAADVKSRGLLTKIALLDDKVIDGRHRLEACKRAGVTPEYVEVDLGDLTPAQYVWSINAERRHMSKDVRAQTYVNLGLYEVDKREANDRKEKGRKSGGTIAGRGRPKKDSLVANLPPSYREKARDTAAARAGCSPKDIDRAVRLKEECPELAQRVEQGELTLASATNKQRQQKRIEELEKQAKDKSSKRTDWTIVQGNCIDVFMSDDRACDARLAFADPPYNIGIDYGEGKEADLLPEHTYLSFCREWMQCLWGCLTDDGSMWLLISDEWAAELCLEAKSVGFDLHCWIKWFEGFGVNCKNKFNRTTRHLFWFVKDSKNIVFNRHEVLRPSDRQTKYRDARADSDGKIENDLWDIPRLTGTSSERIAGFPTQLPIKLLDRVVRCASHEGDLIIDPFSGSGTTGVSAVRNNRRYFGVEKQKAFFDLSTARLKAEN